MTTTIGWRNTSAAPSVAPAARPHTARGTSGWLSGAALLVALPLVAAAAGLRPNWYSPGTAAAVTAALLVAGAASVVAARRWGIVNSGTLILASFGGGYVCKRVVPIFGADPLFDPNVVATSLVGAALFTTAFGATYWLSLLVLAPARRRVAPAPAGRRGSLHPIGTVAVILALVALIVLRYVFAVDFSVGRPGAAPTGVPGAGVVYAVLTFAPLTLVFVLAAHAGRTGRRAALLLALIYAVVGAAIGWRSSAIGASVPLLLAWRETGVRGLRPATAALNPKTLLYALGALAAAVSVMAFSIQVRGTGQGAGSQSTTDFVSTRVGGSEFLEPVVATLPITGPDPARLDWTVMDEFLKIDVYGYSPTAQTGFAPTGVGYFWAIGGLALVLAGGALLALLAVALEASVSRSGRTNPSVPYLRGGLLVGFFTALINFLQEGTPNMAPVMLAGCLVGGILAELLGRLRLDGGHR